MNYLIYFNTSVNDGYKYSHLKDEIIEVRDHNLSNVIKNEW